MVLPGLGVGNFWHLPWAAQRQFRCRIPPLTTPSPPRPPPTTPTPPRVVAHRRPRPTTTPIAPEPCPQPPPTRSETPSVRPSSIAASPASAQGHRAVRPPRTSSALCRPDLALTPPQHPASRRPKAHWPQVQLGGRHPGEAQSQRGQVPPQEGLPACRCDRPPRFHRRWSQYVLHHNQGSLPASNLISSVQKCFITMAPSTPAPPPATSTRQRRP